MALFWAYQKHAKVTPWPSFVHINLLKVSVTQFHAYQIKVTVILKALWCLNL